MSQESNATPASKAWKIIARGHVASPSAWRYSARAGEEFWDWRSRATARSGMMAGLAGLASSRADGSAEWEKPCENPRAIAAYSIGR